MSLVIDPISHRVVDVTSVGDAKQEVGSGALATVTALLLSLSLYSCFVPVSIQTPIGFLSAVDICVALLFPVALFTGSRARSVTSVRLKPLFAAALTFLYLAVAQVLFSNKADATAISKFFIFLVFIPLTFAIGGINARTIVSRVDVPANISRAGGIIAVLLFVQIARGQTHGSEAVLYVDLFGVQVSKNGMGQMMVISTISAAWKWACRRSQELPRPVAAPDHACDLSGCPREHVHRRRVHASRLLPLRSREDADVESAGHHSRGRGGPGRSAFCRPVRGSCYPSQQRVQHEYATVDVLDISPLALEVRARKDCTIAADGLGLRNIQVYRCGLAERHVRAAR